MRKNLSLLFTAILSIYSSLAFATVYTFTGNGNWSDAANWASAKLPSYSTLGGDTIIIQGNCTFSGSNSFTSDGFLRVANGGSLVIDAANASFEIRNRLIVQGSVTIKSSIVLWGGFADVSGTLNNDGDIGTVGGSFITVMNGGNFTNTGSLVTYVTVQNGGTFNNTGRLIGKVTYSGS